LQEGWAGVHLETEHSEGRKRRRSGEEQDRWRTVKIKAKVILYEGFVAGHFPVGGSIEEVVVVNHERPDRDRGQCCDDAFLRDGLLFTDCLFSRSLETVRSP
jgi:hypothetical protein